MRDLVLICLTMMALFLRKGSGSPCCEKKRVGNVTYMLVEEDNQPPVQECMDGCIYSSEEVANVARYCFRIGRLPTECLRMGGTAALLFRQYWEWRLARSPEFASFVGTRDHNAELEVFTPARFQEDHDSALAFLRQAEALLESTEDEIDRLNLQFFTAEVATFIDGFPFSGFHFPINFLEGVQADFQKLAGWVALTSLQDYKDLSQRYMLLGAYMIDVIAMLRLAVAKGRTNHAASMEGVMDQVLEHTKPLANDTVFYSPFANMPAEFGEEGRQVQEQALDAINIVVQPAFRALGQFLETKYLPATRLSPGASSLGDGFYEACLRFHTTTNLTAQQIHDLGLAEVKRIEGEMQLIWTGMGYDNMTLVDFIAKIRADPANLFTSPEELLAKAKDIVENQIDGKLLDIFHSKPNMSLDIVDGDWTWYSAGAIDGSRPGKFFVNTENWSTQPRFTLVSLSLHEASPGHHLQSSYMIERPDWPMFRKVVEDRIYSQAPSRFPINTAFAEGWGLYSESLGFDMGLYDDPLDRFGHLSEEIFRAVRLVVDTGIHALGWTQEEAVQYMLAHSAEPEASARDEIRRYITWPGQATAYKVGQLRILQLRERAAAVLGAAFDLRDFHEVILRSAGPLDMLEQQVELYISSNSEQTFV